MYIRRKVFSVVEDDYTGEERLYSTYDVDYLGDEYYDEYGERMYSDFDDEYEDRYFSKDEKHTGRNIAIGGAGLAGLGAAGIYGGHAYAKKAKKVQDEYETLRNLGKYEEAQKLAKKHPNLVNTKSLNANAPYRFIDGNAKKVKNYVKDNAGKAGKYLEGEWKNAGNLGKAGMIAVPVAALGAAGAGAYYYNKNKNKK